MIAEAPVTIQTTAVPLVERWEAVYVLTFEDAGVSVRLSEAQVRGLGARILSATLDELNDLEGSAPA